MIKRFHIFNNSFHSLNFFNFDSHETKLFFNLFLYIINEASFKVFKAYEAFLTGRYYINDISNQYSVKSKCAYTYEKALVKNEQFFYEIHDRWS